jgi:Fe-S oxidoreductase
MPALSPSLELTDFILEVGGADMLTCMQCGSCTAVCPWPLVKDFSPRHLIRLASLGLEGYEKEDLWNCVTCNTCVTRCPRGVDLIDVMRSCRAVMLDNGMNPRTHRGPLGSLRSDGNPWGGDRKDRCSWTLGLDVPTFIPEHDYAYFACCSQAYDPRNRKVARALMGVFAQAGVRFGVLSERESCCGDQARSVGARELYSILRASNTNLLKDCGAQRVIVSSPHCLQVFNRDYASEIPIKAVHHTQLLAALLGEGKLQLVQPVEARVTYHDPCYLGRHAGEYEAPRALINAIPGVALIEMPRNRESSLCCGGGGGGLWMEVPSEERFAVLRVREAQEAGAQIIATACPYCTAMLEDAVKSLDLENEIRILDVAELVAQSLPSTVPNP